MRAFIGMLSYTIVMFVVGVGIGTLLVAELKEPPPAEGPYRKRENVRCVCR